MKSILKKLFPCFFVKPKKKPIPAYPSSGDYHNTSTAVFFLERLNSYREIMRLNHLEFCKEPRIYDMCYSHVLYMQEQGKASHDGQFERHEYINQIFGRQVDNRECVAKNYSSPMAYLNAFINSPKHKEALIDPNMTHACVAYSKNKEYLMVFLYEQKQ